MTEPLPDDLARRFEPPAMTHDTTPEPPWYDPAEEPDSDRRGSPFSRGALLGLGLGLLGWIVFGVICWQIFVGFDGR